MQREVPARLRPPRGERIVADCARSVKPGWLHRPASSRLSLPSLSDIVDLLHVENEPDRRLEESPTHEGPLDTHAALFTCLPEQPLHHDPRAGCQPTRGNARRGLPERLDE